MERTIVVVASGVYVSCHPLSLSLPRSCGGFLVLRSDIIGVRDHVGYVFSNDLYFLVGNFRVLIVFLLSLVPEIYCL